MTNLGGDMAPVMLATKILEVFFQKGPHRDDPIRHALDFAKPLLVERWIVQDF